MPHPPTPRAKDGTAKAHFNYLLLDPRVAEGVLGEEGGGQALGAFQAFVESVFYVGKGKNARSLQHLRDAKDYKLTQRKVCRAPPDVIMLTLTKEELLL